MILVLRDSVKRRLCNVHVAFLYERTHISEEERKQKRPDVRAVNIGIRHNDYFIVS